MKLSSIAMLLLAFVGQAHAQSLPPAPTSDGSVSVQREGSGSSTQAAPQAPIIVVSGNKKTTTSWVPAASGTVTIKSPSGSTSTTTVLNPTGNQVSVNGSAAAQPATIVRTGAVSRWVPKTQACQAYYSGAITWEAEETQTVVSNWAETGTTRNYLNNCSPIVENRWVARSEACPAYYTGSKTWEAEETRSGGGAWNATGNTRNVVNACTAVTEIRWVAQSQACPSYYSGSNTWEAEQRRVGGGSWTATGATRAHNNTCAAITETRWVAAAQACPANYTGSHTWEAEERRIGGGSWAATGSTRNLSNTCTATITYRWVAQSGACPAGYEGTNTWESEQVSSAGGAWSYTGKTRNQVNNCTLAICTIKQNPFYSALNSKSVIVVPPETCDASREGRQALVYANQSTWNQSSTINDKTDTFQFLCQSGTWTFLHGVRRYPVSKEVVVPGNTVVWNAMVEKNGQSPDHYMDLLFVAGIGYDQEVQAKWAATPGANAVASYGCARY